MEKVDTAKQQYFASWSDWAHYSSDLWRPELAMQSEPIKPNPTSVVADRVVQAMTRGNGRLSTHQRVTGT
jgi:hypothetical protein